MSRDTHVHDWLPRQQGAGRYCVGCDTYEHLAPSRDTLREAVGRYIVAMTRHANGGATEAEVQAAYEAMYDRAALEAEPAGLDDPEPIANETESGYARRRELVAEARARLTETPK